MIKAWRSYICIENRNIMKRLFAFVLALMPVLVVIGEEYRLAEDMPYRAGAQGYAAERCRLDVYYPADTAEVPAVVWFHGGWLTGGERYIPEGLKDSGMAIVAVNYRLMPKAELSDCIDDAAAAVAWAFENIEKYGGDPHKVFVAGHSAGGYLASMIGLDKKWLAKYGVDADSIAALIPYSGQVITHFAKRQQQGISELQPLVDEFAPLFHVRPDAPPYIIISGDREEEIFGRYEENAYMWRMLRLVGHPYVRIYELDGYDHGAMVAPGHHILKKHVKALTSEPRK